MVLDVDIPEEKRKEIMNAARTKKASVVKHKGAMIQQVFFMVTFIHLFCHAHVSVYIVCPNDILIALVIFLL